MATTAKKNLWPEHKAVKAIRHNLENDLYRKIAAGKVTQSNALRMINEAKLHPDVSEIEEGDYCDAAKIQRQIQELFSEQTSAGL